jgi:hypothetical protein
VPPPIRAKQKSSGRQFLRNVAPGMQHYVFVDGEAVVQLNSVGPWGLTYVNEKGDPRKTQ